MAEDYFDAKLALDANNNPVPAAIAKVYAFTDTAFTTPLAITDVQDIPVADLIASPTGIYPAFKVVSGETKVLAKSGPMVTPLTSVEGMKGDPGEPGNPGEPGIGLPPAEDLPNGYVPIVTNGTWGAGPASTGGATGEGVTLYYTYDGVGQYRDANGAIPPNTKPDGRWLIREFLTAGYANAPLPTYPGWAGVESRWKLPKA